MSVTVIGAGRVGSVLARATGVALLGRALGPLGSPVVIATRNDDLDALLPRLPREGLVFVQNGVLDAVIARHGLVAPTLGLLYFAASARDGRAVGALPSYFCGPHAATMVALLGALDLPARELDPAEFRREQGVKLAWNVILGLLGETRARAGAPATVADVLDDPALDALAAELRPVFAAGLGVDPGALAPPLRAYSRTIPDFAPRLKELRWRNGQVRAWAEAAGIACPTHEALLGALAGPLA